MQVGQPARELLVGQLLQLGAADRPRPEAEGLADRLGRDRVVAGDHAHVDAGAEGGVHGVLRLGAQRVDDARHAHEGEALGQRHRVLGHRRQLVVIDEPGGEGEHPQALLAHPLVGGVDAGAGVGDRHLGAAERPTRVAAAREHDVGRALDQLDHALRPVHGVPVEGRHELVVGVERHLGDARVGATGLLGVDAELGRQHDERRLGRIADHRAVVGHGRVAVEGEPEREPAEVRHRAPRRPT